MLNTFSSVRQYLKFDLTRVVIDNFVFKLHYRWTFVMLLVATLLITSRQYIGEHIQCISDGVIAPVINTFCFFTPTFTVVSCQSGSPLGHGGVTNAYHLKNHLITTLIRLVGSRSESYSIQTRQ